MRGGRRRGDCDVIIPLVVTVVNCLGSLGSSRLLCVVPMSVSTDLPALVVGRAVYWY